jgi:hypothetical protein
VEGGRHEVLAVTVLVSLDRVMEDHSVAEGFEHGGWSIKWGSVEAGDNPRNDGRHYLAGDQIARQTKSRGARPVIPEHEPSKDKGSNAPPVGGYHLVRCPHPARREQLTDLRLHVMKQQPEDGAKEATSTPGATTSTRPTTTAAA